MNEHEYNRFLPNRGHFMKKYYQYIYFTFFKVVNQSNNYKQ